MIPHSPISNPSALSKGSSDDKVGRALVVTARATFWSRHSAIINFWLDVFLLVLFVIQACMFAVLHLAFPRGAGSDWKIWGATPLDWSEGLFVVFCLFAVAIVLHVMFHWAWICGIVATRILGRKASKDDGTHTLIGVGLLVLLVHVVIIGVLIARASLVR